MSFGCSGKPSPTGKWSFRGCVTPIIYVGPQTDDVFLPQGSQEIHRSRLASFSRVPDCSLLCSPEFFRKPNSSLRCTNCEGGFILVGLTAAPVRHQGMRMSGLKDIYHITTSRSRDWHKLASMISRAILLGAETPCARQTYIFKPCKSFSSCYPTWNHA